jgi:DNA helicase HerA-like ATPase
LGKRVDALWYSYLISDDKNNERDILRILADKKANDNYNDEIILPPSDKESLEGEYYFGDVVYADKLFSEFGLREDEWIKHVLITGMTGTGKTNTSFLILKQLKAKNKPFLVFDWKKNYRELLQLEEFQDTVVYTVSSDVLPFYFNPLIPPKGTDPKHWLAKLIDVLGHAYFVAHGVEYFFRSAIDQLYKKYKVYEGSEIWPVFKDMISIFNKQYARGREMLWLASAKRVLSSLTFEGLLGNVVNVRVQNNLDGLLNKNVILELDKLSDHDKIFLIEILLTWINEYRKNQGIDERFKHAIVIEEAHHVLSGRKERAVGEETIIETVIRMIREYGESVIVIDQEPSKLSDSIKANTYCKITFNLGNGKDIADIAKCLELDSTEKSYIDKLDVGQAIVKLKGRCKEPFLIKFPKFKIVKGMIKDNDLVNKNKENLTIGSP